MLGYYWSTARVLLELVSIRVLAELVVSELLLLVVAQPAVAAGGATVMSAHDAQTCVWVGLDQCWGSTGALLE